MPQKTVSVQVATKEDVQILRNDFKKSEKSLRAEIKRGDKALRQEILRVEERVENIEEGQKRIETIVNRTANTLDAFLGRLDNLETDNEVGANQISDLRELTDNHETRITKLEI